MTLRHVPDEGEAIGLAERVRTALYGEQRDRVPFDPADACAKAGCRLEQRRLGGARRGLQALLVPRDDHFEVIVDPEPPGGWSQVAAALRAPLATHRVRFRVAHELAHTLFFARDPSSLRRVAADSDEQEAFCDAFARALLVPPSVASSMTPTADSVLALRRRFDVSLEVAARAISHAHPDTPFWLVVSPATEDAEPFVQWRSRASYACPLTSFEILAEVAAARRLPAESRYRDAPRLAISLLAERRQALAFAV